MKASIEYRDGVPMIVVDEEVIPMMAFQFMKDSPCKGQWKAAKLGEIGTRLYFISIKFDDPDVAEEMIEKFHNEVRQLKKNIPNALVMPWIDLKPYKEFAEKYPDEVLVFNDGTKAGWLDGGTVGLDNDTPRYSYASEVRRKEVGEILTRLVRSVMDSGLEDTVIGYFTISEHLEWSHFWDFDSSVRCADFSPAMKKAFRNFLIRRYEDDVEKLRVAWNDTEVTFDTAEIPGFERRIKTDYGWFWDPRFSQQVLDYAQCNADVVADSLEYFSSILKNESNRQALVGAFWGYCMNQRTLWGGQNRFKEIMDSPDIDFWAAPNSYENRNVGNFNSIRFMVKSLQKHRKGWFVEIDTNMYDRTADFLFPVMTKYQSREIYKRDFMYPFCEGTNAWLIDWASGDAPFVDNGFWHITKRIGEIQRDSMGRPKNGNSDIAAVIDQESLLVTTQTRYGNDPTQIVRPEKPALTDEEAAIAFPSHLMYNAIERSRIHELPRIGTPVDFYETDDIIAADTRKYKMYIFLNNYRMDDYERELLGKNLKKDGNVLVFMYGCGILNFDAKNCADVEHISELTGIHMDVQMVEQRSRIRLNEKAGQIFEGLCEGAEVGDFERMITAGDLFCANDAIDFKPAPCRINPVAIPDDSDADIIGTYVYGGQAAFAVKKFEDWTSVYIGSPAVQAYVLRAIAKYAGVHLFVDGEEIIYSNESYLGIHTEHDGQRTFHLKRPAKITEIFDNRAVAEATDTFTEYIPRDTTRLYRLE